MGQTFGQDTEGMARLHGVWGLGWGVPKARDDSNGGELESPGSFFTPTSGPLGPGCPFGSLLLCGLCVVSLLQLQVSGDSDYLLNDGSGLQEQSSSKPGRCHMAVQGWASEVTHHHFCPALFVATVASPPK